MASANRKEVFHSDMETVWEAVTSLEDYAWRSDLDRIEILEPENPGSASAKNPIHTGMKFQEYTKDGFATTFTITAYEPMERYEFDMENENIKGHWTGLFRESGNGTEMDFTEDVEMKKPFLKFAAGMYLKKQQKKYVEDLKKELGV